MARKPAAIPERTVNEAFASSDAAPAHAVTRLEHVLGQTGALASLEGAIGSGRVHHAWIFAGPPGVGKFSTAVAFCATLLDPTLAPDLSGKPGVDPDSRVQSLVRAGSHPDLHIVRKELAAVSREQKTRDSKQMTIPVDVLREFLIEPAQRTAVLAGGGGGDAASRSRVSKAFIIDEAELMAPPAQNLLLKTLEEPAEGTVIVLVTAAEDRLLTTVRSRCQRVGFAPLDEAAMAAWLKREASRPAAAPGPGDADGAEAISLPGSGTAAYHELIDLAQGSPGLARLALESGMLGWRASLGPLLEGAFRGDYTPELAATMEKIVKERAEASVKGRPEASKDAANKAWARRMLAYVAEDTRKRLRASVERSGDSGAGLVGGGGGGARAAKGVAMLDAITLAEGHLASNVNLTLVLENLAAQLAVEPTGLVV